MVIIYKVSPVSYRLGKAMIRVKNIGLVNLIAGKEIVPELIQEDASSTRIASTVYKMLNDPTGLKQLSLELLALRDKLGGPGASGRVADIAFRMLEN
jgi:lipid-A-disaccharide synthase